MRLDQFSNPVFNEQDLFDALYKGQILTPEIIVDSNPNILALEETCGFKFSIPYPEDLGVTIAEYDAICQQDWKMPDAYKTMDIEGFLVSVCPKEHYQRLVDELQEFKARNMIDLLRWLKYFVDTCETNNVVWGVGRGSSVASYTLYLLGVHSVDSIKYNLDWREFLR